MITVDDYPVQGAFQPIEFTLGGGYVALYTFSGFNGKRGILLFDTGIPHVVGSKIDSAALDQSHQPRSGELYISFTNVEIAMVLRDAIDVVIAGIKSDSHNSEVNNV